VRLWPRRRVYVDNLPRTHDLRFATLFILGFLALLGGLYAVGYVAAGDRLPVGTTIAGIDVGGMKRGEASTTLQDALVPRLERPIDATVAGRTFSIDPQRAGMTFDLDATITAGLAGSPWDPRHMLHVLSGGDALAPFLDVDAYDLNATLKRLSGAMDRPAVDASVSFTSGTAQLTYAQEGRTLDLARSRRRLEAALVAGDTEVSLPMVDVDPDVSSATGSAFVSTVATRAVSGPVTVRVAHTPLVVRPQQFVPSLRALPAGKRLRLGIDSATLYAHTKGLISTLPYHPVNARVVFRDGRPRVVASRSGVSLDPADWASAVLEAARRAGRPRTAVARVTPELPRFTTADARMLRLRTPVATAAVAVRPGLARAAQDLSNRLNGALVPAGGSFSFLGRVDPGGSPGSAGSTRSATDGFTAYSAVASAAFRAALAAGMSDLQRTADLVHPTGTADGMDARVEPPSTDLSWLNSTPYGIFAHSWVTRSGPAGVVHVELWSAPYWTVKLSTSSRYNVRAPQIRQDTSPGCTPRAGVEGFDVDVTRTSLHTGQPRRVETFHSSYRPLDGVVCRRGAPR
jgi:vancomycin resistance protein YoaR